MSNDFFKWTLVTSIVFHVFVVLGISFVMPEQSDNPVIGPPLKITLVSNASDFEPDDTQTLAQFNSEGDEQADPGLIIPIQPTPEFRPDASDAPQSPLDALLDSTNSSTRVAALSENNPDSGEPSLSRDEITREINLAYLNAQAQPREKYVGAKAKESHYAAYVEKWRLLVERVGNLNYPEAARQQNLEGSLVLDVAISSSGEIEKVRVLKSSGIKILDDAATRIVHIAAPYDRFPESIGKETDVLHIVRTWEFGQGQLTSKLNQSY